LREVVDEEIVALLLHPLFGFCCQSVDVAEEISVGLVLVHIVVMVVFSVVCSGSCVGLLVYVVLRVLRLVGDVMSVVAIVVVDVDVVVVPIQLHVTFGIG